MQDYDDGSVDDNGTGEENRETFNNTEESENSDESTQPNNENSNDDGIDYERAAAFRNYREQGMSQEEAKARVDEELPFDRDREEQQEEQQEEQEQIDTNNQQQEQSTISGNDRRNIPNALKNEIGRRARSKYGTAEFLSGFNGIKGLGKGIKEGWNDNKGFKKKLKGAAKGGIKEGWKGHKEAWKRVRDPNQHNGVLNQAVRRGLGAAGRMATRTAFGLAGAGVAALGATVTGDFSKVGTAAVAGMAAGSRFGQTINGFSGRVNNTVGSLYRGTYNRVTGGRSQDKKDYINNQKERDYAQQRLFEKNGGRIVQGSELDAEMERRYQVREMGITDNDLIDATLDMQDEKFGEDVAQITGGDAQVISEVEGRLNDNAYNEDYQKLINENNKMDDKEFNKLYGKGAAEKAREHKDSMDALESANEDKNEIKEKSISKADFAARMANKYNANDFKDEKKMKQMHDTMQKEYVESSGSSQEHASAVAKSVIKDAAKIKGVKAPNFDNII